jgi:Chaperone of endosialidase
MGIFDIFSTEDQRKAADDQISGINKGIADLSQSFGQGRDALSTNYAKALSPFTQNYGVAGAGQDQLARLLGFGPGGSGDIMKTLQSMPGYQFTLDQGNQNILRNQAATGQLNSGATNLDLQKFGQGTANQNYMNYVQSLMPFLGAANSAAGGIAGVNTGLGNQLNQSFMGEGNAKYGADTSIGNANANADLAGLTASKNWMGLLGGAANALMMSDERAKDDIEPVGKLYDGQDVYRYRYKGDPRHQIGLIAQEVERDRPHAVGEMGGGFKGVDYRRATDMAAELGRFLTLREDLRAA